MPLDLFYTMVQKSQKWPKTQIKGGSCLKPDWRAQKFLRAVPQRTRWITMLVFH